MLKIHKIFKCPGVSPLSSMSAFKNSNVLRTLCALGTLARGQKRAALRFTLVGLSAERHRPP